MPLHSSRHFSLTQAILESNTSHTSKKFVMSSSILESPNNAEAALAHGSSASNVPAAPKHFLDLPPEIRNAIYLEVNPHSVLHFSAHPIDERERFAAERSFKDVFKFSHSNRQIREEVLTLLFSTKPVYIRRLQLPQLYKTMPAVVKTSILSIILHHFEFDGGPLKYRDGDARDRTSDFLFYKTPTQILPNIKRIEVRFLSQPGLWADNSCLAFQSAAPLRRLVWLHHRGDVSLDVESLMRLRGIQWLCDNSGLDEFVIDRGGVCGNCMEHCDGEKALTEMETRICEQVFRKHEGAMRARKKAHWR